MRLTASSPNFIKELGQVADHLAKGEILRTCHFRQAYLWYCQAVHLGYASAMIDLAQLYENGYGVAKDAAAAALWRSRASRLGAG